MEVTLIYPKKLHDAHSEFPLCPEKRKITYNDLSNYSKMTHKLIKNTERYDEDKLTSTFLKKRKIILHKKNLDLYLSLGMKLRKIHRVLRFRQSLFLKKYIDLCTTLRAKETTKFGKNLFKLMSNRYIYTQQLLTSLYNKLRASLHNKLRASLHFFYISYASLQFFF